MSNQPPYGYPGGQQGYQGGGFPPPSGPAGKTKVLNLDYNVAAMLAYLPICCVSLICSIIWIASEPKENKFLRFHALQSLLLTGASMACFFVLWVISIVTARVLFFGLLILLVELALLAFVLVVFIMGAVKGYQGQMWKLPVIGDIAEKNC